MAKYWAIRMVGIAVLIAVVLAGFGNAVLYLWNALMPAIFGLAVISYWQAIGLLSLSWIFFGSWRAFPRVDVGARAGERTVLSTASKEALRATLRDEQEP